MVHRIFLTAEVNYQQYCNTARLKSEGGSRLVYFILLHLALLIAIIPCESQVLSTSIVGRIKRVWKPADSSLP